MLERLKFAKNIKNEECENFKKFASTDEALSFPRQRQKLFINTITRDVCSLRFLPVLIFDMHSCLLSQYHYYFDVRNVNNRSWKSVNSIEVNSTGRKTTERNSSAWFLSEVSSSVQTGRKFCDAGKNVWQLLSLALKSVELDANFTTNCKVCLMGISNSHRSFVDGWTIQNEQQ